ncbi:MAG: S66 peptidase family protein [Nitrospinales bacterium]
MPGPKPFLKPARLKKGDAIGVVAPAGPVDYTQLDKGLNIIRQMGLNPVSGKHILSRSGFLAGTDEERAEDLMSMFRDPKIKGIFCARGGYGVNRILPLLDSKIIRKNPKIVVGSSDITFLLLYLQKKCSLIAFHGPLVAASFGSRKMRLSEGWLWNMLSSKPGAKKVSTSMARVLKAGKAEGQLAGGCLTLQCRSLKTPYEINTDEKILLIEDVNEPAYRIDGMLWQLRQAGKFKNVQAVIFGEMVNCKFNSDQKGTLDEMITDFFKSDSFPVIINCPVGHGKEIWTLPLGVGAKLNTKTKSLTLDSCGVV